jgi:gliding motility-associated-like protein
MNKKLCILLFLMSAPLLSLSQDYEGTDFRFAFLKNLTPAFNGPPIFDISIYATEDLTATVEYGVTTDGFYLSETIEIAAGDVGIVSFDEGFLNQETLNVVETRSFRVSTTENARVYAFHNRVYFAESSAILPVSSLGTDYRVMAFEGSNGSAPSLFNIIGTEDNTTVEVTPTGATLLGNAFSTYTVNVDAGEVITISSSQDLTGSIVSSTGAPVAVFGGQQQGFVGPTVCSADSHFWEQLSPISEWSTAYPILPVEGSGGDLFRILSITDGTELYAGCDLIATLDEGEFFEEYYDTPFILTSSEPVSVAAFIVGNECSDLNTGDPNMRMILPLDRGNTELELQVENPLQGFVGPGGPVEANFIHLSMLTANTGSLTVNGAPVNSWQAYASEPDLSYARVSIPDIDNLLSVQSDSPFWAELISLKEFDAFTMSLGSNTEISLPPLNLTIVSLGPDQTICPGQSIILDPGLGISGTWQDGSFQETYSVIEAGTYSVTIEDACGDGSDEVIISEGFLPTVVLPSELIICGGDIEFIEVEEEPGVTYTWSTGEEGGTIEVEGFGTYTVTAISQDGCESEASTEVLDGATAEVILIAPEAICENAVDSILASANEEGTFTWSDGTIGSKLTISESGDYSVLFVPESGCEVEEEVSIDQLFAPFVFANDTIICDGDVIQVRAQSPNGDAFWPGISDSPVASISEEGAYEAAAENECGIAFFTVNIGFKDCSCPAYVPNAFTPNGDGLNDLFVPNILCEPEFYDLVIFNRWGIEVFSSTDITKNWNGDSKNNPDFFSSEGVYNYILKFDNPLRPLQSPQEITGTVTLIR